MSTAEAVTARCGAQTRSGGACGLPAGHGTDHVGHGRCRRHGGNTRNHVKSAAQAMALAEAKRLLGEQAPVDPTEAMLATVRVAAAITAYYRTLVAEADEVTPELLDLLGKAAFNQNRIAKNVMDAGVAERLVRIAERWADAITLAVEDGIARFVEMRGLSAPSNEERTIIAQVVQAGLSRHEQQPVIEGREA